ncbi:MAG: hypothetical protein M1820_007356 [Bogoriella megaspora]|nr:MAG: hypothetical protein M1820_007356 [Bogoriella megaspora]
MVGGHTKAASYRSFLRNVEEWGEEEAVKIARLEYANIKATHELAKELGIECDANGCDTVDVMFDQEEFEEGKMAIERLRRALGEDAMAARYTIYEEEEARTRFLAPDARGAFVYEAGSIHAYKFTIGILKRALKLGLNLQTGTPAISIARLEGDDRGCKWRVETPRGEVRTQNLILATNGYTPHLLPKLLGKIVPLRGQVNAQHPGPSLPRLPTTYSFIYRDGYEYMIQSPTSHSIIIGGGLGRLNEANPDIYLQEFGQTNDGEINPWISTYLKNSAAGYFGRNWGEDKDNERVQREWTGIMGTSADGLPLVGAVPGEEGLWLSFACNGHGMVLCLKCAEALTDMLMGETAYKEWFPEAFRITEERLQKEYTGRI